MDFSRMKRLKHFPEPLRLALIAALFALPSVAAGAQTTQTTPAVAPAPAKPAAAAPADSSTPDRARAYYHAALASIAEEEAVNTGQSEYISQAIDQYKNALDADPGSAELNDALADLYFRVGRARDAETTARNLLKTSPNDLDAHKLLGRIYLRQLGEAQNSVSSSSPSGNILDQAIAEFEKIIALEPRNVDDRMVLGQLYTVKHEPQKAEDQFKTAQSIDPDSEDVVLNLARLYVESGDIEHAAKVDRSRLS